MDETLIFWRALHFAATIQVVGVLIFRACVLRTEPPALLRYWLRLIFWISLALALISGAGWLCAVAGSIDDASWMTAVTDGTALTVLTDMQFGRAWLVRLVVGLLLGIAALARRQDGISVLGVQMSLAIVFASGLAFAGHGASTPGRTGDMHLAADILHILAVSAWLGGLLPYALYLSGLGPNEPVEAIAAIHDATRRFSNIGVVAVLTISITGIINTLNLVGSPKLLAETEYGRLLSIKIAIFLVMVMLASINRFGLAPRLSESGTVSTLRRNTLIEAALGLLILGIVAALGTMPPTVLDHAGMQQLGR